ncbi:MAG: acylphosphatase [Pirellulaceae bacterium]
MTANSPTEGVWQRVTVRYEGRVQGVGFRMIVLELSHGFAVVGRVCNVSDGSVRLVAEGLESELLAFLQSIRNRMGRCIVQENADWSPCETARWEKFAIDPDLIA